MSFIESYKHLDKICGEMFETQYGVSAYIEEMLNNPHGSFLVRGWENDLKQLKHYRWIRNQIVHEPDCSEESMCEAGDDEWLDDFYERIINQTDPLAMYLTDIATISANLAGIPAISVPAGFDSEGMPIGLQIMTPQLTEAKLFNLAYKFEQSHDYYKQLANI